MALAVLGTIGNARKDTLNYDSRLLCAYICLYTIRYIGQ